MMPYEDHRRQDYGYMRMSDTDSLMTIFVASGKRNVEYWAEHIKHCTNNHMTYVTFKTRLRNYLKRTKQRLSGNQNQRIRVSDEQAQQYLELFLHQASSAKMNITKFYEEYIIVPPYNKVPSFEMFKILIYRLLKELKVKTAISLVDLNDPCNVIAIFEQQKKSEVDNLEQPAIMEMIETDSEATSELDNTEQLIITEDTNLETTTDNACWDNQPTTVQINLEASRVKIVYKFVRQLTGTLGSDGSGGPINGELRVGCMQKIIAFLVAFCSLTSSSRFVDIGSGQGKPSFHVAQSPGVRLSIGVEVERLRWMVI
jgi:hypothetical protein